jgi:biopolymer transport protein ExbB/TolQ
MEFFLKGGPTMWILLVLAIIILALSIKKVFELFIKVDSDSARLDSGINAILFWGVISAVAGVFFHFMGIYEAMLAISRANDISPAIVSYGYSLSLITILSGLFILMISSVIWFVFRWRYKSLVSKMR